MSAFQSQHKLKTATGKKGQMPIIYNVMNFAKGDPALLSLDDARTLFHEFGHALHGMLSDVTYPSVAGTAVSRDFVELPSQLYEHWLMVPEILSKLRGACQNRQADAQGAAEEDPRRRNLQFRLPDRRIHLVGDRRHGLSHRRPTSKTRWHSRQKNSRASTCPTAITMRHRTPHFAHVFAGDGYSAGYYSYMWSEVLDADAFRPSRKPAIRSTERSPKS